MSVRPFYVVSFLHDSDAHEVLKVGSLYCVFRLTDSISVIIGGEETRKPCMREHDGCYDTPSFDARSSTYYVLYHPYVFSIEESSYMPLDVDRDLPLTVAQRSGSDMPCLCIAKRCADVDKDNGWTKQRQASTGRNRALPTCDLRLTPRRRSFKPR
jgi:hypothetical protein